jgi:hypothetical protein
VNAWVDGAPSDPSNLDIVAGYLAKPIQIGEAPMHPGALPALANWRDEKVGWGLVLAENTALTPAERATPWDAPEPIQHLWESRGRGPVFRYDPIKGSVIAALRRYFSDGAQDPDLVSSRRGIGKGQLPRYLLIYGTPEQVPWELQYALGRIAFTGRLDLTGDALENYVTALCDEWDGAPARPDRAVVWAAFHGNADITALMLRSIATKVHAVLASDDDIGSAGAVYIDGSKDEATHEALRAALADSDPGLVVTTSHGSTSPLNDAAELRAKLGLLIDNYGELLDIDALLGRWEPGGAIWYAHACCSAGAARESLYRGLLEAGSPIDNLLQGLTIAGNVSAPLPRALLGAPRPLRAFIGHVEPTFDWTLKSKRTGQILTTSTREALYNRLYQPLPVGLAIDELHRQATQLHAFHQSAKSKFGVGEDTEGELLALRLTANDRESLVILGDPTVALPPLGVTRRRERH